MSVSRKLPAFLRKFGGLPFPAIADDNEVNALVERFAKGLTRRLSLVERFFKALAGQLSSPIKNGIRYESPSPYLKLALDLDLVYEGPA